MVLTACSGAGSGSTAKASGGTTVPAGSADPAGILKYGYDLSAMFTNTFDPAKSNGDCDAIPLSLIYASLLHRDAAGKLNPDLALSVTQAGRTITIKLRPGVVFSDNEAFTADAVKAGLLHNKKNTQLTSLAPIDSIDVVDPLTLVVHYQNDTGVEFVGAMAGRDGYIVAPNAVANASNKPVGAGPFVLSSYSPGGTISVRPNPLFWDKTRYKIAGVDFIQVGVGPPSLTALRSGSVDIVNVDSDGFTQLHTSPGFGVAVQQTTAYLQFQFRNVAPFDNQKLRQAVLYAINKDELNKVVESGQGEVATQPFPMASLGYDASLANLYPYNPAMAKQLLTEAGFPNGISVSVAIPGGNISEMERMSNIVQQQLAQVGIRMNVIRILGSDIATQYYIAGNGVAFLAAKLGSTYPPDQLYSSYGVGQFVPIWNKFERADINDLMVQALKIGIDPQAWALTKQADQIVMSQALEAPLVFRPEFQAYSSTRLGGVIHAPTDICDPDNLTTRFVKK